MDSTPQPSLTVNVDPLLSLAAWQHRLSAIRQVQITNRREQDLHDLCLRVHCDPSVGAPLELPISEVHAGTTWTKDDVELDLSTDRLRAQVESEHGTLTAELWHGEALLDRVVTPIRVLPPWHWPGMNTVPDLLAAWVLPNHPAIETLLIQASERLGAETGDRSLSGYQKRDPQRVAQTCQAIYGALATSGVRYAEPPQSFEQTGQRVRSPEQVVGGLGTCLDLSLVLAAALQQAGIHPLLVVIGGHAFVGAWLHDEHRDVAILDDVAILRSRVDAGRVLLFDSSSVAQGVPFQGARQAARAFLDDDDRFRFALDVAAARRGGFRPLALGGDLPERRPAGGPAGASAEGIDDFDDLTLPEPGGPDASRTRLDKWKDQLLDLTLRNRLLNFKATKKTLPLLIGGVRSIEERLTDGEALELRPRAEQLPQPTEGHAVPLDPETKAWLDGELEAGRVYTALTEAELDKRGKELYRDARTAYEEAGAITLYLSVGLLKWFEARSSDLPRYAPLLLVPVELKRERGGKLTVHAADDETRFNVTLLKRLETDFDADTTGIGTPPEDGTTFDVREVFQRVRAEVGKIDERWEVLEVCHVGQFSFTKFLMWLDLEARAEALRTNTIVQALIDRDPAALPEQPESLPAERVDERPAAEVLTVVDADPTQLEAIFAVDAGANIVLQGPPGTGKSQTITNLIAQLLASGRSVLFVSEKMAALSVVERRLAQVGLAPFTLELHSHKASKRNVLRQIEQALEVRSTNPELEWQNHAAELEATRDQLNRLAALLGEQTALGMSRFDVLSALIGLRGVPRVRLQTDTVATADPAALHAWTSAALAVSDALEQVGSVQTHPWTGVQHTVWTPGWRHEVEAKLDEVQAAAASARDAVSAVTDVLDLDERPATLDHLAAIDALVKVLIETPRPARALLTEVDPSAAASEAESWRAALIARQEARTDVARRFRDDIYGYDLDPLVARFERWATAFFLFAFFMLWGARKRLTSVASGGLPANPEILDLLRRAQEALRHEARVESFAPRAGALLGANWRGVDTSPGAPAAVLDWAQQFRAACAALSDDPLDTRLRDRLAVLATEQADLLGEGGSLRAPLIDLRRAHRRLQTALDDLTTALDLDRERAWSADPSIEDIGAWAAQRRSQTVKLRDWCALQKAVADARTGGLGPVVDALDDGRITPAVFVDVARRAFIDTWWEHHLTSVPALLEFRGWKHEKLIARFQELDAGAMQLAQQVARARLAAGVPDINGPGSEQKILRGQLQRKIGHMPVRKLFERAPTMLRHLKPCVLMSPLSVAQYLDPAGEGFDVVIFDEASQIPTWDAIGAIARGKQVVIVGDTRQLPPTSFFDRSEGEAVFDDEFQDLESVLDEAVVSGLPQHWLRWHYRSRHEELIAFSNHHYYDNRLQIFPAATQRGAGLGVEWRPVPDGFYDRGKSRTNQAEAEAIVAEIEALLTAGDGPPPSLGVVTFSRSQQRCIEDLVEALFLKRPELEQLATHRETEPLFVKNLENVQGDERDVMLFSVCYGPDRNGYVAMNFGPLNKKGGERRLNVAVTRARQRTLVFSTLRPDQISLARSQAIGVRHLKAYLEFAQRGVGAIGEAITGIGAEVESPFEAQVKARLEAEGWTVHPQVGCSGFRIDLGVLHPDRPGHYLLGIECDGATYHSSATARERDRQRQAVLEGLGWTLHRIWSTDWWHDPESQLAKVRAALDAALQAARSASEPGEPTASSSPQPQSTQPPPTQAQPREVPLRGAGPTSTPPTTGNGPDTAPTSPPVYTAPPTPKRGSQERFYSGQARTDIGRRLVQVVEAHGPLHVDDAFRAVARSWGFGRLGSRVKAEIESARKGCPHTERPVRRGDFLWPANLDPDTWRDARRPGEAPDDQRNADRIPPEEAANALREVLGDAVGYLQADELFRHAAALLGFQQVARKVRALMERGLALLDQHDRERIVED